jgi:tetratricopeptide (TPR) repeat protein
MAPSKRLWTMPWVLLVLLFAFPPAALVLFLRASRYPWTSKILVCLGCIVFCTLLPSLFESITQFHQKLWIRKFVQSRNQFKHAEADRFLNRIPIDSSLDKLEVGLLQMRHHMGQDEDNSTRKIYTSMMKTQREEFQRLDQGRVGSSPQQVLKEVISTYSQHKEINFPRGIEREEISEEEQDEIGRLMGIIAWGALQGGMPPLLEYALSSKASKEDSFELLSHALILHFRMPEDIRMRVFTLEFYLLSYLIRFEDQVVLDRIEKAWRRSLDVELTEFVSQSPYHLKAYDLRGFYQNRYSNLKKAESDWVHVFKIDVTYFGVGDRLIRLTQSQADAEGVEILSTYARAERLRFSNAQFLESLDLFGSLLEKKHPLSDSLRDEVLFNMGVIYRNNIKDYEKALEAFSKILEDEKSFRIEEAMYNLVMTELQLGNYSDCEARISEFLEKFPTSGHHEKLALILLYSKSLRLLSTLKHNSVAQESM